MLIMGGYKNYKIVIYIYIYIYMNFNKIYL